MIGRIVVPVLVGAALAGCSSMPQQERLENVAKEWAMTIRASQVIPVYPLTEDLMPGDVFLVQVPVDEQQKLYEQDGFLALDNLVARLHPSGYAAFYGRSFLAPGATPTLPRDWLAPAGGAAPWSQAPNAKFPSYSFSARRGAGLNLALPVQGVPVGLSLLGGDAADGTIVISDAKTYGVDTVTLDAQVREWSRSRREFLASFAPAGERRNYLRVVTRVYLTGGVDILLRSSESRAAGVSVGAAKPVDLLVPGTQADVQKQAIADYQANVDKLNQQITKALERTKTDQLLPGGSLRVSAASAGSITMKEDFPRPIAIGYLGFDVEIGPGGVLGASIPTHAVLRQGFKFPPTSLAPIASLADAYDSLVARKARGDKGAAGYVAQLDALAALVPAEYPCNIYDGKLTVRSRAGTRLEGDLKGFRAVSFYRGSLALSADYLSSAATSDTKAREDLKCTDAELQRLAAGLRERSATIREAVAYASEIGF